MSAIAAKPGPVASATCADVQATAFCGIKIADLCGAIEKADSLKQRNIDGMISKVVGASIKMNQYKGTEAEYKLGEVGTKVDILADAAKPKISDDDANAISAGVNDAVTCVIENY
jgi:hypothetical protein